ncbi:MAG: response regulator [Proteobacteria bacterium]|nr:response regulator [Pseudomonadota bacterium]
MAEVVLTQAHCAALFAAYLIVDDDLRIREMGPYYPRSCSPIRPGDLVDAYFATVPASCDLRAELDRVASNVGFLQLRCREQHLLFGGCVLRLPDGYLLALNQVPQPATIDHHQLDIANFGKSDPAVPVLMLLSLQRALLEEAQQNALELSRERERGFDLANQVQRVASYIVHDFNNFLSIIDLNAHRLLSAPGLGERERRMIGIILETTQRGSELVGSLQRITGTGEQALASIVVDEALVADRAFLSTIVGAAIGVRLELGAPGARIGTSRTEFFNCLTNLLINARDAMPAGGTITITTRIEAGPPTADPLQPPPAYVTVVVRDTGIGMDAETLARAFEPHYSTKGHGSGLGLSSVLEFTRAIGGEACVDSAPGKGAAVHLYLPRVADETPVALLAPPSAGAATPHQIRILLVDDEPYAVEALAEMLAGEGFAVSTALSGTAALELARRQHFDLLLTDVVMPDLDGIELARRMSVLSPGIGVVLMSGYMPPAAQFEPAWQFAKKPLDRKVLLACFDTVLGLTLPA